jgi:phage gp46-like protein
MARYDWSAIYDPAGTPATLSDIQNITIQKGRVQITDPFKASTATITGRDVASLPTIEIGGEIEIYCDESAFVFPVSMFYGVVADVQIVYGQVPAMDVWTIHCEDALATAGRSLTGDSFSWSAGIAAYTAGAQTMTNAFGGSVVLAGGAFSSSTVSAQSKPDTNVLQLLNELAATEQGYLSSQQPSSIKWINRAEYITNPLLGDFTDGSLVTINTEAKFNDVSFRSQADSFFDKVVVEPDGLAAQSAGTGSRVYTVKTYDQTTTQAKNLADYILATLQVQQSVPSTISAISEVQTNDLVVDCFVQTAQGSRVGLILRGVEYQLFLEGATVTATPEQTRFTYNVVSADALAFFILDDVSFGRLDADKLGF